MIRSYCAELTRLLRRKVLLVAGTAALLFGVGGSAIVLAAAEPASQAGRGPGRAPTVEALSAAGGGTEIFRVATSFAGTFLFVVFVGVMASEFSRGTIRTMLLHQPRRLSLLAGKVAALLTFAAATLALTEAVTWSAARVQAAGAGVDAGAWTSLGSVGAALADFGAVLLWVTGYAVLGTTVAVLLRSVPLALAVGIAWAGPIEHLLQDAWAPASRLFPGLLLEAFVAGGTTEVTAERALATVAVYSMVAAAVALFLFARRDVTA
jgi:ABC-2 type transport system permease protein